MMWRVLIFLSYTWLKYKSGKGLKCSLLELRAFRSYFTVRQVLLLLCTLIILCFQKLIDFDGGIYGFWDRRDHEHFVRLLSKMKVRLARSEKIKLGISSRIYERENWVWELEEWLVSAATMKKLQWCSLSMIVRTASAWCGPDSGPVLLPPNRSFSLKTFGRKDPGAKTPFGGENQPGIWREKTLAVSGEISKAST
jgi:hypothetical protein